MFSINDKQKQIRFKMIQMTFVNCISIIPNNFHNVIVPFLFDFDDDLNRFFPNEYESESVVISTSKNDEWRTVDKKATDFWEQNFSTIEEFFGEILSKLRDQNISE